jgi:hypothetical protein
MEGCRLIKFGTRLALSLLCTFVAVGPILAADDGGGAVSPRMQELQDKLKEVRRELESAREAAAAENKRFNRFQHDVVYTNMAAKVVYTEMRRYEQLAAEKRKELNELMNQAPEMIEIKQRRKAAYDRLSRLKDKEQLVLNDIKAERYRQSGRNSGDAGGTSGGAE